MAAFLAHWRTTHQTTFSLIPEPQTVPLWVTQRKIRPSSMLSNRKPFIDGGVYPVGHWDRANMATFTE